MFRQSACLLVLINMTLCCSNAQSVLVRVATCENRIRPMGVPLQGISFSWQLESKQRSIFQKAYQLVIASNEQLLQQNEFDVYNSGRQESGQSLMVGCKEATLQPGTAYYWKVKVCRMNRPTTTIFCRWQVTDAAPKSNPVIGTRLTSTN